MKKYKLRKNIDGNLYDQLLHYRQGIKVDIDKTFKDISWNEPLTNEGVFLDKIVELSKSQEPIAFFLDADSDGINSGCIMYWGLRDVLNIRKIIICVRDNGYGIQNQYYDELAEMGIKHVMSADIGITAKDAVEYGNSLGITTFITDHHPIQPELKPDCLIINPKLGEENNCWMDLAGCGVVYVLIKKLYDKMWLEFDSEKKLLHHVMTGTIGDMVSLTGVNRLIVKEGLSDFRNTKSKGLKMILNKSYDKNLSTSTVSFGIVPLINSMNRIGNIYNALRFFLTEDENERSTLCDEIFERNELRKTYQHDSISDVKKIIEDKKIYNDDIIFIDVKLKKSIAGLVSSWLTQSKYGKPSLVVTLSDDGKTYGGSGRGCGDFDATKLIEKIKKYCINAGGHVGAYGVSFTVENMPMIKDKIKEYEDENKEVFNYEVLVDRKVELREIDSQFVNESYSLAPYGMGNPAPLFMTKKIRITSMRDNLRHSFITVDNISSSECAWDELISERKAVVFHNVITDDFKIGDIVDCVFSLSKDGNLLISDIWHSEC